jgi:uncharacterized protein YgbK (DUF1537 family)
MMPSGSPEVAFIGDDFTGASDALATFARAGLRARLFLDAPDAAGVAAEGLDAVGIATDLRTLPASEIADRLRGIAPTIAALRPRFLHYKVCSTFDSSPAIGSIGAAVRALDGLFAPTLVVVIGGQPSLGRYCLFGNLFARAADGAVYRIDRHPVMRSHPATPMDESDLRHHLNAQGLSDIELLSWLQIGRNGAELAALVGAFVKRGNRHLLFDVSENADIETIGAALRLLPSRDRPILVVGASSVAESLTAADGFAAGVVPGGSRRERAAGPCLVIAGSRSSVTAAQVAAATCYDKFAIAPCDLAEEPAGRSLAAVVANVLREGRHALVHLAPDIDYGIAGVVLARRLAGLSAEILDSAPVRTLGIAGGDTSSVIVHRLGFESLIHGSDLDTGVAICVGRSNDPERDQMRLMLKGGQMGQVSVFDRLVGAPPQAGHARLARLPDCE